ncbi:hypothetical protein D6C91_10073 [Aureobasidium pullulans]|uniref:BTB domain-containing protein n=1 Tax=Aureobasidium pullulans TaxID=5580 RepID=A0A4V6TH78_AURPU|nr:hypothetical protein D6C91_10073 [Aureobasidium pullulans]
MSTPPTKPESGSTTHTTKTPSTVTKAVSVTSKAPSNNCFRGIVVVEVGPEKQAFSIHKDLLCFYSDYFRGAFDSSFKEAAEGKSSLPTEDPAILDIFNGFIYTRQLRDATDFQGPDLLYGTLVALWIFGDKYIVPALQNKAIDAFKERSDKLRSIAWDSHLRKIYDNTLHGSPLRRIMTDMMAYETTVSSKSRDKVMEVYPLEALVDLAFTLFDKSREDVGHLKLPAAKKAKCYYHIRNEGESCT